MIHSKINDPWQLDLGANFLKRGTVAFKVWAPFATQLKVKIFRNGTSELFAMQKDEEGYFSTEVDRLSDGTRYWYLLNGEKKRPDPVSRFQPRGVHDVSEIADPKRFKWNDQKWKGLHIKDFILYEIHVGTFTPKGTFEAVIPMIPYLKKLGVTCLEIMPVAQFPGTRNWGYDGTYLYAVQNSYGGPLGLKKLVNACHRAGLAVCLDVVYNHLGPEGNYLNDYGPYFANKYHTPWGPAINYDGPESNHVRRFIINNALYWITEYHVDALRLDAIHGIFDFSAKHILEELNDHVKAQADRLGREVFVIAESDLNDSRIIRPKNVGGYGLDAQWNDDFHHALHVSLTGESKSYYQDFSGLKDLAKAIQETFVHDGGYSPFRRRRHGNSARDLPGEKFVICSQNHDQIGNRALGDRLSARVSFEAEKLAAALLILSPYIPLLFMGQEYGEKAPFQYFIDHTDPNLIEAVRKGRQQEFISFNWNTIPDPKSLQTFIHSRLNWKLIKKRKHKFLYRLYQDLIWLRNSIQVLRYANKKNSKVTYSEEEKWLAIQYMHPKTPLGMIFSFSENVQSLNSPFRNKIFSEILNTEDKKYGGSLPAKKRAYSHEIELKPLQGIFGKLK